jgi:hypothetical protein
VNIRTAQDIAQAILDVADARTRITALERVLEEQQPALYAAFQRELENLRNSKAHDSFLESVQNLQRRLESE